jgi:cytochrome c553
MGKLKLESEAEIMKGGASGPAIVPGNSAGSLLVKRLLGATDAPRMPLGADPLPVEKVALIRAWIDQNDFTTAESTEAIPAKEPTQQRAQNDSAGASTLFAMQVRPILASRCYSCHGPNTQQNGLRLDSLASILAGSESGKIVKLGHADQSRLVRRLEAQERPQMPYGGPPLSKDQVALIRQWIDSGAPGPDSTAAVAQERPLTHWAYLKPVRPELPAVKDVAWSRNPIDRFILAALEQERLAPSAEADRTTLLRRVYLDLTGLPPSPQEVDAFVADQSPGAYDLVVDRLLASPRYGERWARPWLDLARFADTNGYEKDGRRTAWVYRDWVIRALNQDMSFKQFTIEQIAGDMLPRPAQDQLVATGFHRNTMLNQEGGVDPEEYYWYSLVDRANTTASVWLGSTLGCAQCHNHKFDPFTQKDYYRFLAFFADSHYEVSGDPNERFAKEPQLELPTSEQAATSKALRADIAKVREVLATGSAELAQAQNAWELELRNREKQWTALLPVKYQSAGGAELKLLPDGSLLAGGKNPQADTYTLEAITDRAAITGLRIEVLPDPSLPRGGPGRDPEGNFFLSDFEVDASAAGKPETKQRVVFKEAEADESQDGYDVKALLKKDSGLHGWAIDAAQKPERRQAVLTPEKPFGFEAGTILTIRLKHNMRHSSRNLGRFRLSLTTAADPAIVTQLPARLRPVLEAEAGKRTGEQQEQLAAAYRNVAPLLDQARKELARLEKSLQDVGIVTAMIMREEPGYGRPTTNVRERGSFLSKGDLVYADVPSALNPLPKTVLPNRLGLAEWLVSEDNPLTARVTVNRFWETIFGRGIVETSEDFGTQGDAPSHPELLDWLATEFMSKGWSVKAILREIVTSATYRQSSRVTPELIARDPYNRLYARGPRFRVEAEVVHDLALAASGLLSSKMYGPSVFPYQPEGIWDVPYSSDKWIQSEGEDSHRRAVYTYIRRSAPYPSQLTFDAPSREFCTVRRVRTNTPLQALTTLNDPYFFDAARAMARRTLKESGGDDEERAAFAFRLCASRPPQREELEQVLEFYRRQLAHYRENALEAKQTIRATVGSDSTKQENDADAPELAAWTMVANVLLNMDETITKE